MKTKLLTFILTVVVNVETMFAITMYGITINGITYNLDNTNLTAEVAQPGAHFYLSNIVIPATLIYQEMTYSVTSIGDYAFNQCSGLKMVTIGSNIISISGTAFSGCSGLSCIVVEAGNTRYDSRNDCDAIIETFENSLIQGCRNTKIPNSVTSIGGKAFYGCSGLTSIEIPENVAVIGYDAFRNCSSLSSVTCLRETPASIGSDVFAGCSASIYVPCSSIETYKKLWSPYSRRIYGKDQCSYTIKFVNWNGDILQSSEVKEGETPQYIGMTPEREDDEQYIYAFAGWTPQIVAVYNDATYTAIYTSTPKSEDYENVIIKTPTQKILHNALIHILRNDKTYTVLGQELK